MTRYEDTRDSILDLVNLLFRIDNGFGSQSKIPESLLDAITDAHNTIVDAMRAERYQEAYRDEKGEWHRARFLSLYEEDETETAEEVEV